MIIVNTKILSLNQIRLIKQVKIFIKLQVFQNLIFNNRILSKIFFKDILSKKKNKKFVKQLKICKIIKNIYNLWYLMMKIYWNLNSLNNHNARKKKNQRRIIVSWINNNNLYILCSSDLNLKLLFLKLIYFLIKWIINMSKNLLILK